jgi:glycosyltransferase involved in cell wall biosynthesis
MQQRLACGLAADARTPSLSARGIYKGPHAEVFERVESHIHYLIVVPVRFHRISETVVASESAFCEHLRLLRRMLAPPFATVSVAAPAMDPAQYERDAAHLGRIDEVGEGIQWVSLHPGSAGGFAFWLRHFVPMMRRLWREVSRADLVHAGITHNLFRPFEFPALLFATLRGKKTICVVDIDLRDEARMNFLTGRWSRKSYLVCETVYDPLRSSQLSYCARRCSLVLLKGRKLWRDYGGLARPNVKYFLDAAFSAEQLIPPAAVEHKLAALGDPSSPLELVYFGRLTGYKGIDRCIEAVALARDLTRAPLRLSIIGAGEEEARLKELVARRGLERVVDFRGALPFGRRLFDALYPMQLLLAAPLSEDTPRSALDAMASGIPILAFATGYYSDLEESGAVDLVPWPSVERLAERIAHFAADKRRLVPLMRAGLEFARANSQESWLKTRIDWTRDLFPRELAHA